MSKKALNGHFSTKNNKIMLLLEHILNKIKMLILYALMKKNYSLCIFQLRKSTDFIVKVSEIIFFQPDSKMRAQIKNDYLF